MEEIEQAVVAAPGEPEGTHDSADPQQVTAGADPGRCQRQPQKARLPRAHSRSGSITDHHTSHNRIGVAPKGCQTAINRLSDNMRYTIPMRLEQFEKRIEAGTAEDRADAPGYALAPVRRLPETALRLCRPAKAEEARTVLSAQLQPPGQEHDPVRTSGVCGQDQEGARRVQALPRADSRVAHARAHPLTDCAWNRRGANSTSSRELGTLKLSHESGIIGTVKAGVGEVYRLRTSPGFLLLKTALTFPYPIQQLPRLRCPAQKAVLCTLESPRATQYAQAY
jgi:hypothetical protein